MMKKIRFLSLLLVLCALVLACTSALAATPDEIPDSIRHYLATSDRWHDWTITSWTNSGGIDKNLFVVLHKDSTNDLLCFDRKDGGWVYSWHNDSALPQGKFMAYIDDITGATINETGRVITDPAFMTWYVLDEELMDCACIWEYDGSAWQLTHASFFKPMRSVVVTPSKLTFYLGEGERDTAVHGQVQTNLRYFSLSAFPTTSDEAKEKLSNPPAIPEGELSAKEIKFTGGKKYKVYHGPGTEYGQAGNGKAAVSTNDWIQVFGESNGWIMIQYDITSEKMRIGWIKSSALPKKASVSKLEFTPVAAYTTTAVNLTDDPLFSRTTVVTLPEGVWVEWLATMGDWAYVESSTGDLLRGFIPVSQLTTDYIFHLENNLDPTIHDFDLKGTLSLSPAGMATLVITDGSADADAYALYDVTLNQRIAIAPRGADGSYYAQGKAEPAAYDFLLVPVDAQGNEDRTRAVSLQR